MSYDCLHLDAKTVIARTSIAAWNALMRADPVFGRYALTDIGRADFLTAFTVIENEEWRVGGKLHRIGMPAIIYANSGGEAWYQYGKLHRADGPAVIHTNGGKAWYEHGKRHRTSGPALIHANGTEEWYEHGIRHRAGTPDIPGSGGPAVIYANGRNEWWERGHLHRIGGPAITDVDGSAFWYENGGLCMPGGSGSRIARSFLNRAREL